MIVTRSRLTNHGWLLLRSCFNRMFFNLVLGAAVLMDIASARLGAQEYLAGQIIITQAWAPPTLGKQRIGVAYFRLHNQGPDADRLLAVELPDGGEAGLHTSLIRDGVMRMRPLDAVAIPAGGEAVLQPGGMHVMLSGLPGPLAEGGRLKLRLRLERAGVLNLEAAIEKRPAASTAPSPHQGH